jgi:alpha-L-fucosidase
MWRLLSITIAAFMLITACQQKKQQDTKASLEDPKNYLDETEAEKEARMEWWKDARFGMFIHWGLYAVPAGEYKGDQVEGIGEWIMNSLNIPIDEYEQFAKKFNPTKYDAQEWVRIAKDAGMKYIVITSKHHDGFALWDSKVTDWDVVDATPYEKDLLKQLADACREEGIKLCFYHSIMDWHHPDAQAMWEPNYNQGRDSENVNPNFQKYIDEYMKPQLKELLTEYGDIGVMWFDGEWVPAYTSEMGKEVYNYVRNLQPDIIINNRVDKGRKGMEGLDAEGDFAGDFGTPEQEIPDTGMPGVDWESCMTMNDTWGYKSFDDNWKSNETLITNLIDIVSKGGNFLLNVGPTAEGLIPQPSVERLKAMGDWMEVNGESIYGAQASPFAAPEWGRFTQKDGFIYAHIFEWPEDGKLLIPSITIKKAYLLADVDKKELMMNKYEETLEVSLPSTAPNPIASVVVLEME